MIGHYYDFLSRALIEVDSDIVWCVTGERVSDDEANHTDIHIV